MLPITRIHFLDFDFPGRFGDMNIAYPEIIDRPQVQSKSRHVPPRDASTNQTLHHMHSHKPHFLLQTDIAENSKEYEVSVDVPGIPKEEIDVSTSAKDNSLTITVSAARAKAKETVDEDDKSQKHIYKERLTGSFKRMIQLPTDADTTTAVANVDHGVLYITLKKKSDDEITKKVHVN